MSPLATAGLSTLMLVAMLVTFAGALFLAERTPVLANHVAREIARTEQTGGLYYFDNGYVDEGDYVLLEKLHTDDYSRGGVYFLGTSEMQAGFMNWALTPEEARLIHDYSIGNLRHREVGQFLRMLVEENGLLEAGGGKTTIVLSLNFQLTRINTGELYVQNLFHRHGLYTFDAEEGIHNADVPAWRRWMILKRDRVSRALRQLLFPYTRVVTYEDSLEHRYAHMRGVMEGDWRGEMSRQVAHLDDQIAYLQERGVHVRALYAPRGGWQDDLPYEAAYIASVARVLSARSVPVTDLRRLVPDEQFRDAIHVKYQGRLAFHEALMDIARQSLRDMGTALESASPA